MQAAAPAHILDAHQPKARDLQRDTGFCRERVRGTRIDRPAWPRVVGYALAVLLALTNAFIHSRDGYTAVVPTGLMLSTLVVAVLVLTAVLARVLTNRHRFGA